MKKKLIFGLSMIGVAAASVGTTLAVLSNETETKSNVFTTGNVEIVQNEYERVDKTVYVTQYANSGDLQEFTQNQVILPTISKNGKATDYSAEQTDMYCWGEYVTKKEGIGCNGLWNPAKVENVVDKIVMVENTGNTDSYFRTLIAVETPEGMDVGEIPQGAEIMLNSNIGWYSIEEIGKISVSEDNVSTNYTLIEFTYTGNNGVLTSGETARPSLLQIALAEKLTNEDMEKFGTDGFKVLVATQAVQNSDMLTASEALDRAFGDITVENNPFVK